MTVRAYKRGEIVLKEYVITAGPFAGGSGNVYKIKHKIQPGKWALKVPNSLDFVTLFKKECMAWKRVSKVENVVDFYGVVMQDNLPHVLSEWMDGGSLDRWIADKRLYSGGGTAALSRILSIALQTAKGLHGAHVKNVIHKDVKPANILLNLDASVAKISYFGLAANVDQTRGKSIMGATYAFASPEQIDGDCLFASTDIFSWAASVINMLLGSLLWQIGTVICDKFDLIFSKAIVKTPPDIIRLLRRCVDRNPAHRIKCFSEVIKVLEQWKNPIQKQKEDAIKKTDLATARILRKIKKGEFKDAVLESHDFFTRVTQVEKDISYSVPKSSLNALTTAYFCALSKCTESSEISYKKIAKLWNKSPFFEFKQKNLIYFMQIERELRAKKYLK